ncbi:hypothetical protein D1872_289950 [compost metagenome]
MLIQLAHSDSLLSIKWTYSTWSGLPSNARCYIACTVLICAGALRHHLVLLWNEWSDRLSTSVQVFQTITATHIHIESNCFNASLQTEAALC